MDTSSQGLCNNSYQYNPVKSNFETCLWSKNRCNSDGSPCEAADQEKCKTWYKPNEPADGDGMCDSASEFPIKCSQFNEGCDLTGGDKHCCINKEAKEGEPILQCKNVSGSRGDGVCVYSSQWQKQEAASPRAPTTSGRRTWSPRRPLEPFTNYTEDFKIKKEEKEFLGFTLSDMDNYYNNCFSINYSYLSDTCNI